MPELADAALLQELSHHLDGRWGAIRAKARELAADPRFATNPLRLQSQQPLLTAIGDRLRRLTTDDVIARLEAARVPVGPILDLAQVLHDPGVRRRGMVLAVHRDGHGGSEVVNGPWKVDGRTSTVRRQPPRLGEHTDEVLANRINTLAVVLQHVRNFNGDVESLCSALEHCDCLRVAKV